MVINVFRCSILLATEENLCCLTNYLRDLVPPTQFATNIHQQHQPIGRCHQYHCHHIGVMTEVLRCPSNPWTALDATPESGGAARCTPLPGATALSLARRRAANRIPLGRFDTADTAGADYPERKCVDATIDAHSLKLADGLYCSFSISPGRKCITIRCEASNGLHFYSILPSWQPYGS